MAILALGVSSLQAQITTIKTDYVVNYLYGDTLIKNASFSNVYYVKDFVKNARLTLVIDTMASAAQHPKVRSVLLRSANAVDYYSVAGDTVTATSSLASGHKIATSSLISNIYEPYVKVTTTAIDSTQNSKVKYILVIDKNE